jgi:hypothetical protein
VVRTTSAQIASSVPRSDPPSATLAAALAKAIARRCCWRSSVTSRKATAVVARPAAVTAMVRNSSSRSRCEVGRHQRTTRVPAPGANTAGVPTSSAASTPRMRPAAGFAQQ